MQYSSGRESNLDSLVIEITGQESTKSQRLFSGAKLNKKKSIFFVTCAFFRNEGEEMIPPLVGLLKCIVKLKWIVCIIHIHKLKFRNNFVC